MKLDALVRARTVEPLAFCPDSIIAEDKVDMLLVMPSVAGGSIGGRLRLGRGSLTRAVGLFVVLFGSFHWTIAFVAFWVLYVQRVLSTRTQVGFASVSLTTEVVDAVATAIMACFAEVFAQLYAVADPSQDPVPLSETHPLIFHRFVRISEFSTFRARRLDSI